MFRSLLAATLLFMTPGFADEGMWLFNQVPREKLEKAHGVRLTDEFLHHLQLSAVKFGRGGSASFVSPDGLIFTNHHVGRDCVQKLSTASADYMAHGFSAATLQDEQRCAGLEVAVLLRIEDVTSRVNQGIPASATDAEANQKRKASIAAIESECSTRTGHRCEVITLYAGGLYHLYEYRKYTDVRLVFAPEYEMAIFGGDPDNFNYPRFGLDFSFFRAYENGKPAKVEHWLKWSAKGVQPGELALVAGHPGTTGRLLTVVQLEFMRDVSLPLGRARMEGLIGAIDSFARQGAENRRLTRSLMRSIQNSYKSYTGQWTGLRRESLMNQKRAEEAAMRAAVMRDAALAKPYGSLWDDLDRAYVEYRQVYRHYYALESGAAMGSEMMRIARGVLRLAEERGKPDAERLTEFTDARRSLVEATLFAQAPISNALETAMLAEYLRFLVKTLGPEDATVKAVLGGRTPEKAAAEYIESSRLGDVEERKRLSAGVEAAQESKDGMLRLARLIDGPAREARKHYEDRVEAVLRSAGARIARARFAIYGTEQYPDATGTLRLTWGPVKGYGKVPYATTIGGLFARNTGEEPTRLPQRWLDARKSLKPETPYNFVSTADIHGGNSGSPTVNSKGEIIGIIFDGNLESLPNTFVYSDAEARAVHVASQVVLESLRKVYQAKRILKELGAE